MPPNVEDLATTEDHRILGSPSIVDGLVTKTGIPLPLGLASRLAGRRWNPLGHHLLSPQMSRRRDLRPTLQMSTRLGPPAAAVFPCVFCSVSLLLGWACFGSHHEL
jgi:hypothetical protein